MLFIEEKLKLAQPRPGQRSKLSDLDVLTILAYDGLVEQHQTLKRIYDYIKRDYNDCFRLPSYQNFLAHCHRLLPQITRLLTALLTQPELVFCDSTPLAVCHPMRAKGYRTVSEASGRL